jgi:hypothetical protein
MRESTLWKTLWKARSAREVDPANTFKLSKMAARGTPVKPLYIMMLRASSEDSSLNFVVSLGKSRISHLHRCADYSVPRGSGRAPNTGNPLFRGEYLATIENASGICDVGIVDAYNCGVYSEFAANICGRRRPTPAVRRP